MQKTGKIFELGSYKVELFPDETRCAYDGMPDYDGENPAVLYFHHLMGKAPKESVDFLESLGVSWKKIVLCRPLTAPDENGEILYLACAPLGAKVLEGGDTEPRQSEEIAGISVIFVGEEKDFSPDLPHFSTPCAELRFVIPLPFDASFFEQ